MEYRGNSEKRKYSGFSRALLVATLIVTGCSLGQSIEPTLTPIVVPPTAVVVATAEVPTIEPTGPTEVVKATLSYAPATPTPIPPTISPVPTVALTGKVCATCESLRVRQTPGTAGKIITQLPSGTAVTLIGRTADSTWFQVITPDGKTGWGWAAFITTTDDVNKLSVTTLNTANEPTSSPAPTQLSAPTTGNVVTGVTSTSRQIFLNGQAKGNLATVFTRIGDSLTASPAFLNPLAGAHGLSTFLEFDTQPG